MTHNLIFEIDAQFIIRKTSHTIWKDHLSIILSYCGYYNSICSVYNWLQHQNQQRKNTGLIGGN